MKESKLTLAAFLDPRGDRERREYEIQHALNFRYYSAFRRNALYPQLAELVSLLEYFSEILAARDAIEPHIPKRLTGVDPNQKRLLFETLTRGGDDAARTFDFIEWAIPVVERAVREGTALFDFVEERVAVETVGIVPVRRTEGYWAVPAYGDPQPSLHVYAYWCSVCTTSGDRVTTVAMREIDRRPIGALREAPETIRRRYLWADPNMPTPAFFVSETDLNFPFQETILPVAKRKLKGELFR